MIVFDGDSVMTAYNVPPHQCWGHIATNGDCKILAEAEDTAEKCYVRADYAISLKPELYVLQIGQWSHNHESVDRFEYFVGQILSKMNAASIRCCVVTPPMQQKQKFAVREIVAALWRCASTARVQFIDLHTYMSTLSNEESAKWVLVDHAMCHFNEYGARKVAEYFNKMRGQTMRAIVPKPWGREYLVYENDHVGVWLLEMKRGHRNSMHCHPTKTTGFVLLSGDAYIQFLADRAWMKAPEKHMVRRGLFHSVHALTDITLFEIETPNDKDDIVRLSDPYGRAGVGYEKAAGDLPKTEDCLWINGERDYSIAGRRFSVERAESTEFILCKNDNDILVFLRGGLVKTIDGRKHLTTVPGDVGRAGIVKQVAREMEGMEPDTLILTVPA